MVKYNISDTSGWDFHCNLGINAFSIATAEKIPTKNRLIPRPKHVRPENLFPRSRWNLGLFLRLPWNFPKLRYIPMDGLSHSNFGIPSEKSIVIAEKVIAVQVDYIHVLDEMRMWLPGIRCAQLLKRCGKGSQRYLSYCLPQEASIARASFLRARIYESTTTM